MLPILLILLLVIPTLFSVPYITYITVALTIGYVITRIIGARNLRSSRKLAEKKGEENEIEIGIKKENETNFIENTTDIIGYIWLSFIVSLFILYLLGSLPTLIGQVILLATILCLITVTFMNHMSPFHEDARKWKKHYRDFCKRYMDDRYQEFLREERKQKR